MSPTTYNGKNVLSHASACHFILNLQDTGLAKQSSGSVNGSKFSWKIAVVMGGAWGGFWLPIGIRSHAELQLPECLCWQSRGRIQHSKENPFF